MARELGVELAQLEGSGPGGRIVKADVQAAAESGTATKADDGAKADGAKAEAAPAEGRRRARPSPREARPGPRARPRSRS